MKVPLLLFLTLTVVTSVFGLYEDQIGRFDWHQKYFGPIRFILNDLNQPKRIIVGTENNVIGAVNSNNGAILYRNIMEANSKLLYLGNFEDRSILSISSHSVEKQIKIRSFAVTNGVAKKEWILGETVTHAVKCWMCNSFIYLIDAETRASVGEIIISKVQLDKGSGSSSSSSSKGREVEDEDTGLEGSSKIVDRKTIKIGGSVCTVAVPYYVCATGKTVSVVGLADGVMSSFQVDGEIQEISSSGSEDLTVVALKGKGFTYLYQITQESGANAKTNLSFKKVEYPIGHHFITLSQSKVEERTVLFITSLETGNSIQMDGFNLSPQKTLTKNPAYSVQVRSPMIISSLAITKAFCSSSIAQCALVGFTKDEFFFGSKLDKPGVVEWHRQESLANVLAVEMVDYPSELGPSWNPYLHQMDIFTAFASRVKYEIESLISGESFYSSSEDRFGLRKVIVFVTAVGKVLGMDSGSGQILYTFILPEFSTFKDQRIYLYIQRPAKYAPLKPLASVVYPSAGKTTTILFPFNPVEGKHLDEPQIYPEILQSQILLHGKEETNFLKPVLLLDSQNVVHSYPVGDEGAGSYFFLAKREGNGVGPSLKGFSVRNVSSGSAQKILRANELWSLNLGQGELIGVYGKLPCEKIHSQGRVLPDRSVSYKYMNPNIVIVVTEEKENGNVNLFFVDAVAGSIIHSFWHKKSRGPVHVVHSEHWTIYSLYNEKFRRFEVNSVELYEGQTQSNSTAFSSFSPPPTQPIIVKQAYIFPTGIQQMGYTRTEKGITNKDILIGLPSGGILELPRMILQPRLSQQHYLTQVQDEEGNFHSMPYIPELPVPADMIVNYNQSVRRIRGIRTWPTRLESTCLVLAYGSDLFYTKVSPSKTFDVLKDDFDHWFITVVLAALCLAAYMTKRLSARKLLEQAWR